MWKTKSKSSIGLKTTQTAAKFLPLPVFLKTSMTHSHLESALTLKHFCTRDRSWLIAESSRGSARHTKCPRTLLSASLRAFWTKLMKWKARLLSAEELLELAWVLPEQVPCRSSTVQMPLSWWTKETKPCIFEYNESASKAWKPRSYSTAFTYINTIFFTRSCHQISRLIYASRQPLSQNFILFFILVSTPDAVLNQICCCGPHDKSNFKTTK